MTYEPAPVERIIANGIVRVLEQSGDMQGNMFFGEDIVNILDHTVVTPSDIRMAPEEERAERIRKMIEELEHKRLQKVMDDIENKSILPVLASHLPSSEGIQVVIGGENRWAEMKDVSLVLARYGQHGKVGGMLGIIGPTRMQYGRAIAVVRYMAQVMDELLAEVYGYDES